MTDKEKELQAEAIDYYRKQIAELKEKISVLLSCKNCPENKGGLICEKEYENKCLAQKIQYIKELQEENAELDCQKNRNKFCYSCANATEKCFKNEIGCPYDKYKSYKDENAELKEKVSFLEDNLRVARKDREDLQLDVAKGLKEFVKDYPATAFRYLANEKYVEQLTKAKTYLKYFIEILKKLGVDKESLVIEANQFLSEVEK